MMKKDVFLINCSRGAVVDEVALIEDLENKKIAGTGLDVFSEVPPKKDNPLFKLDNVVIAPCSEVKTKNAMVGMTMVAKDVIGILEGNNSMHPVNYSKKIN